jgi:hypothetical protein
MTHPAVAAITKAIRKLEAEGWRLPTNARADAEMFEIIEAGSTGIHRGFYEGEWPEGSWFILCDDGDVCGTWPMLVRPIKPQPSEKPA